MKLALGTVQFGLDYGITNNSGQVDKKEACDILEHAIQKEIYILDTASAYGTSESILGDISNDKFNIVSKIPSYSSLKKTIRESINESLSNLKRETLYGLMFHDENDLFSQKKIFLELIKARDLGLVKKIGCSFYSIDALKKSLSMNYQLDIIQIPTSCLDQRFLDSGLLDEAKERGTEIHCRSLFLQGLLLNPNAQLPTNLLSSKAEIFSFFQFCKKHNISPLMASLKFLQQIEVIDYGVIGCLSKKQLIEITIAYEKIKKLDTHIDFSELSSQNTVLLNPTLWS